MPKIPGVSHPYAVKALEKAGFRIVRQGKHIVMSDSVRIVTTPRYNPINAYTMGGELCVTRVLPSNSSKSCSKAVRHPVMIKL